MAYINDIEFLTGKYKFSYLFELNSENNINEFIIEVDKDGKVRKYEPIKYLNYILEGFYNAIDEKKNSKQKYIIAGRAKRELIHLIEEFKEEINQSGNVTKSYDFSGVLLKADSTLERLRLEYENKWYYKKLPIIAVIISFFSLISPYIKPENEKQINTVIINREAYKQTKNFNNMLDRIDSIFNITDSNEQKIIKSRMNSKFKALN